MRNNNIRIKSIYKKKSMNNNTLTTFSFAEIAKENEVFAVLNFVTANSTQVPPKISINYPCAVDGVLMGLCLKGSATIKINFKEYKVKEKIVFTILPNQILETIEKTDDLFIGILIFSVDFFVGEPLPKDFDIAEKIIKNPCVNLSISHVDYLLQLHSFIADSLNRDKHIYSDDVTRSLLLALIKETVSVYSDVNLETNSKKPSHSEVITEQFFKLLSEHYIEEKTTVFYADKLCITPRYLSRVLKKTTGKSTTIWIDKIVIAKIKVLLKSTELTVAQISDNLNFPNSSFFCKFFKKHTGMTPLRYRAM